MFEIAEYIGIIAFAISGFFIATRNHLDLLGILISVFLTALGGGIMRDIAVDITPYTFSNNLPALIILTVMILMILFKFHKKDSIENKPLFILSDSIGLMSFSITGALIAIEHNFNITGVLALSFITAVGGGIARDVIINQVPFVFKTGFYGTISLLVGLCLYLLNLVDFINYLSLGIIFITGVALRVIAYYKKWSIPLV
ncbi:MAG TPA: trimeric intracellular cation channel family protein [Arcobacter sp.]|nr:trimeric intracellular cation channel family protein [Arcobacter sp.]HIP55526.1 trimeric intracellular cation channel family protein [Arcobacter sp.]